MKLGRTYTLTVQVADTEAITVAFPLTLTFEVSRNTLAAANKGHFQIFNLKPETRKKIFHDRYNTLQYRQIKLQAGYEDEAPLPTIFQGNVIAASSYRQGTNWITEIEAFDGGFGMINGQVSTTIPAGWTFAQGMRNILASMPNIAPGVIGDFTTPNSRGVTLMGNSWDVANQFAQSQNASAFVDLEKANFLSKNEYILAAHGITKITSATGLLQTPRRYEGRIDTEIVFEPRIVVGQIVDLESLEAVYNGNYQVIGVTHRGTISGAVGGELSTVANLWAGTSQLQAVAA